MPAELDVLARVGIELYYRSTRIHSILDEIRQLDSPEYREIARTVGAALQRVQELLPATSKTLQEMPGLAPQERDRILLQDLARYSRWFTSIHELLIYLPSRAVLPETVSVLKTTFPGPYATLQPSCTLGSIFNAFEFDFYKQVGSRLPDIKDIRTPGTKNIVLQLPLCDRHSPGGWGALAHEMGHAIDFEHRLVESVVGSIVNATASHLHSQLTTWGHEICADLLAAEAIGPSGILSLLSLEYCLYPLLTIHVASKTHPTTRWRLAVISDYLRVKHGADYLTRERELHDVAWGYSLSRALPDPAAATSHRATDDAIYKRFIQPLANALATAIKPALSSTDRVSDDSLQRCERRLTSSLLISAQGQSRESLRAKIASYRTADYPTAEAKRQAFSDLAHSFQEQPLNIPTMLLALHNRRRNLLDAFLADPAALADRTKIEALCGDLSFVDGLVMRSLGTTGVHHSILARMEKNP